MGREDEIRVIAYHIWEEEGCCNGRDFNHWLRAEVIWTERQNPERTGGLETASEGAANAQTGEKASPGSNERSEVSHSGQAASPASKSQQAAAPFPKPAPRMTRKKR